MNITVKQNGGAHVIEMANRATVQKLDGETLSAITARQDNHESGLNTNAHGISNIAGLQTALNGKSNVGHGHTQGEISGLSGSLAGKSDVGHIHSIANVTGLQTALDGKASDIHTHSIANVTGLQTTLDGKANVSHAHSIADVTGLQGALDGKADVFSGYTGSITVVKTVNFASQNVTTATINISNGIITSII